MKLLWVKKFLFLFLIPIFIFAGKCMPKTLTLEEARILATSLAINKFDQQMYKGADGVVVQSAHHFDTWMKEVKTQTHWEFWNGGTDGPEGTVTFKLDGSNPQVSVNFSDD